MAVYVDDQRLRARVGRVSGRWSHLMADSVTELLDFGAGLGLRPEWLKVEESGVRFDVAEAKRRAALRAGAVALKQGSPAWSRVVARARSQFPEASSRAVGAPVAPSAPSASSAGVEPIETFETVEFGQVAGPVDDSTAMDLAAAARVRSTMGVLPQSDLEVERLVRFAADADAAQVTPERIAQVNELAQAFYATQFRGSWAREYLAGRLGVDVAGHPEIAPGYAPKAWTALSDQLRGRGVTDAELEASGLALRARTGRLVDRFRDRLMFPVVAGDRVLSFVGRRHPSLPDTDSAGPKYLNGPDTVLFSKGFQLFGMTDQMVASGAVPVLVEGPVDAHAVTLSAQRTFGVATHFGVATLGTSLTAEQARQLATGRRPPVVARDGDVAGRASAERDFWLLAQHAVPVSCVQLPDGVDPAGLLERRGWAALAAELTKTQPLGSVLVGERLEHLASSEAVSPAVEVVAAMEPALWLPQTERVAESAGVPVDGVQSQLLAAVQRWNSDPAGRAQEGSAAVSAVRARLEAGSAGPPSAGVAPESAALAAVARARAGLAAATNATARTPRSSGRPVRPAAPGRDTHSLCRALLACLVAAALASSVAGCSRSGAPGTTAAPVASSDATATGPGGRPTAGVDDPDDATATDNRGQVAGVTPPRWDEASRAAALAAAVRVMAAFARPAVPYERWWDDLEPLLSPETRQDYSFVDPSGIEPSRVTGPAVLIDTSSVYLARVRVPTDAGAWVVLLRRDAAGLPWLAVDLVSPARSATLRPSATLSSGSAAGGPGR